MTDMPLMFQHATTLYEELVKRSKRGVFTGRKGDAFRAIGVSQGYYSALFNVLTELGCIEQTQRGSSRLPSVILLHHPPDAEDFVGAYQKSLTRSTPLDSLRQQVDNLARRLPQADLNDFILRTESRLAEIEKALGI